MPRSSSVICCRRITCFQLNKLMDSDLGEIFIKIPKLRIVPCEIKIATRL